MRTTRSGARRSRVKFRSADQAVRFAYRMRGRPEYARTDPGSVRSDSHGGVSPLELHGESASILLKVGTLPEPERSSVLLMYGEGMERLGAVVTVCDHIMPLVASSVPDRAKLHEVLMHWATRKPTVRGLAKRHGVSYRQVCKWRSAVAGAWAPIHARAMERLDNILFADGAYERAG